MSQMTIKEPAWPVEYRDSLAKRPPGRVRSFIGSVWRELALRRERYRLEAMSERDLADIGIGRGQIDGAIRHGRERFEPTEAGWRLWHRAAHG